jgi:hypothetical protein
MRIRVNVFTWIVLLANLSTSAVFRRSPAAVPVIGIDFADPAVIQVQDSWFAYATGANGVNVQLASSSDGGRTWNVFKQYDALPQLPDWVDHGAPWVWAPDVVMIVRIQLFFSHTH